MTAISAIINQYRVFIFVTGLILFFSFCLFPLVNSPFMAEEHILFSAAKGILENGRPFAVCTGLHLVHPPFYIYTLAGAMKILGANLPTARSLGIVYFIISVFLVFKITKLVSERGGNKESLFPAFLSILLYVTMPVALWGSTTISSDSTALTLTSLFFTYFFLRYLQKKEMKHYTLIILTVLLALVFWSKETTALGLLFALLIFLGLKGNLKEGVIIAGGAVILAIVSWLAYCKAVDFDIGISTLHFKSQFFQQGLFFRPFKMILLVFLDRQLKLTSWFSLPFFVLAGIIVIEETKLFLNTKSISAKSFIVLLGLIIFFGHLFAGGIYYGYPRYHLLICPFFAIIFVLSSSSGLSKLSFRAKDGIRNVAIISFLFFYVIFLRVDPIQLVNFQLKKALIFDSPNLTRIIAAISIYLFIIPSLFFVFLKRLLVFDDSRINTSNKIKSVLVVLIFVNNVSFNFLQAGSSYSLNYCYGEDKTRELVSFLKSSKSFANGTILAPDDILYSIFSESIKCYPDAFWNNPQEVIKELKKNETACLVYSIPHNTMYQFRNVFLNNEVVNILSHYYYRREIGTYIVWLRR